MRDDPPDAGRSPDLDAPQGPGDPLSGPLDPADPRFTGLGRVELPPRRRELVESQGPGPSHLSPLARVLRGMIPLLVVVGLVAFGAMLARALAPGPSRVDVGDEEAVRAAVAEAPRRVCRGEDGFPCAWLTVVDGRLIALSTSGPIQEEFGRQGVGWCPTSGYYGSSVSGSRYDPAGNVVSGPSPRGLDRYAVRMGEDGRVLVHFGDRTAGQPAGKAPALIPPAGDACAEIPYARDADLRLD